MRERIPKGPVLLRRALFVAGALVTTFAVVRVYLHHSPHANLDFGLYNIHHLYTGLLLVVAGGIPLILWPGCSRVLDACALIFGAGLSMCLDEWVYLIVTDGSDASYLLPVSLWGGVAMVGMTTAYIVLLVLVSHRGDSLHREREVLSEPPRSI